MDDKPFFQKRSSSIGVWERDPIIRKIRLIQKQRLLKSLKIIENRDMIMYRNMNGVTYG